MSLGRDDATAWLAASSLDHPSRRRLAGALAFSLVFHAGLAGPLFQFLIQSPLPHVEHVLRVYLPPADAEEEEAGEDEEELAARSSAPTAIEQKAPLPMEAKPPSLPQPQSPSRPPPVPDPQVTSREEPEPVASVEAKGEPPVAVQVPVEEAVPAVAGKPTMAAAEDVTSAAAQTRRAPSIHPVHAPPPRYPKLALRLGLEGQVLLRVWVTPEGVPSAIVVTHSSGHESLDNAAREGVREWRFEVQGGAEDKEGGWVTLPVTFRLQ